MMFIPREDIEETVEENTGPKISLSIRKRDEKALFFTLEGVSELPDYEKIVDEISGDAYLGTDWLTNENGILVLTENPDGVLESLKEKNYVVSRKEVFDTIYELYHEFIRDRAEYEAIADTIRECIEDGDRLFLCYKKAEQRNSIFWYTPEPQKRLDCILTKDIEVEMK